MNDDELRDMARAYAEAETRKLDRIDWWVGRICAGLFVVLIIAVVAGY